MDEDDKQPDRDTAGDARRRQRREERRQRPESTDDTGVYRRPAGVGSLDDNRYGEVEFDAKGNAVWQWRTEEPRRREDDPTIDLLECLTSEQLSLADPDEDEPSADGFNPYDRDKRR
jgi:hypothetical protein